MRDTPRRRSFLRGMAAATGGLAAGSLPGLPVRPRRQGQRPPATHCRRTGRAHLYDLVVAASGLGHQRTKMPWQKSTRITRTSSSPLSRTPAALTPSCRSGRRPWRRIQHPDVTQMHPHLHTAFASRGAFVQSTNTSTQKLNLSRDDFWPQTIDRLSWDGKLWGLPAEISFILYLPQP